MNNSWIENTGVQPVADNVKVEVVFKGGDKDIDVAGAYTWEQHKDDSGKIASWAITHYRECEKQTLDTAYDVPPINSDEVIAKIKRPESKYSIPTVAPLSPEQQIVEIYKIAFGEHIDEKVVSRVLQIHYDKQRWEQQ